MAFMVATLAMDLGCTQNHPYRMVGGPPGEWHTVPVEPVTLETDYCQLYEDREGPYQRGDAVVPSVEWVQDDGVDVYKLGYVEIDDHGNQFNPAQLVKSLEALEPDDDAGVVMVTFVHGWNHNAYPCDGNVRNFRLVLRALAKDEARQAERNHRPPRHIRGMYVAWRGRSFRGINPLTFWARKQGAHRVGERSAISVFTRVQSFAERVSIRAPQSKFVTIGHSFGAAVVHTALEARLVPELAVAADAAAHLEPVPLVRGLGQVTVLLNPAFEAGRYRHSHELAQEVERRSGFHVDQRPVLLVLTSAKDSATRYTFRVGMRVRGQRGQFIRDARGDERKEYLTAVGHYAPFWTPGVHVDCTDRSKPSTMAVSDMDFFDERGNESTEREREREEQEPPVTCSIEGWRRGASTPILSVYDEHGEVMSGHNDVFNPELQALIWKFVRDVDAPPLIDRIDPPQARPVVVTPEAEEAPQVEREADPATAVDAAIPRIEPAPADDPVAEGEAVDPVIDGEAVDPG